MRARSVLGAVLVTATLSACSLAGDKTGAPPAAAAGARTGGTLRIGITAPSGLDPLDAYEPVGKLISTTMCDTAVAIDPETGQLREALARGWVLSKSGITVKLRHGVHFSDGSEFRAKDVNYTLQQLVQPANGLFAANLGKQFVSVALDKKENDVLADPNKAPDVVFSVSKWDFQVVLAAPNGGALRSFAEPAMAPISQSAHASEPAAFARNPVCVGPYVLVKPYANGDSEIVLRRAKTYYAKNVGYTRGGTGYADRIVFHIYPSAAAAIDGYGKGEVDVVSVPRDQAKNVDAASVVYGLADAVEFVGLPAGSNTPFSDADLRIALSQAVDRQQLVDDVFGPASQVADGFEPPALAISEGPSLEGKSTKAAPLTSCGALTPAQASPEAARQRLARVKALKGFTLEVNDDGVYPAMADALAAQWKANLGLDVTVVKTPWDQYVAKAESPQGLQTPFRIRWSSDAIAPTTTYNDRQPYLISLLTTAAANDGNWAHYDDRTIEYGVTQEAAAMTDVQQRGIAFNRVARRVCSQMPMIPLAFDRPAFLVRPGTVGLARKTPVGRDGVLLLRELYLKR